MFNVITLFGAQYIYKWLITQAMVNWVTSVESILSFVGGETVRFFSSREPPTPLVK